MKRLFFALWPDQSTRSVCLKAQQALMIDDAKPVAADNFHVTLLFLGSVNDSQQTMIERAASQLSIGDVHLYFDKPVFWKKPAVGCLVASQFNHQLAQIAEHLRNIAITQDITIDQRPFTPHVTLFRKLKTPIKQRFDGCDWHSTGFCLVESCTNKQGVEYRVIRQWP